MSSTNFKHDARQDFKYGRFTQQKWKPYKWAGRFLVQFTCLAYSTWEGFNSLNKNQSSSFYFDWIYPRIHKTCLISLHVGQKAYAETLRHVLELICCRTLVGRFISLGFWHRYQNGAFWVMAHMKVLLQEQAWISKQTNETLQIGPLWGRGFGSRCADVQS